MAGGGADWPASSVQRRLTRNLHSPTHHLRHHDQQELGTFTCTFKDTSHFSSEKRISYIPGQGRLVSENNDTFHLDQCRSTFSCYDRIYILVIEIGMTAGGIWRSQNPMRRKTTC